MIAHFLLVLVILLSLPVGLLGEFRCPQSCVCSTEKGEMRCKGTPALNITNLLQSVSPTRLRKVYVEGYTITNLTSRHIDALIPWLRTDISNDNCLSVARNKISDVRDNAFRHLETYHLQRVTLAHNRLTVLRRGMFHGLSQIRELDLSYNQITSLHPGAFSELKLLGSIYLDNNQIVDIAPGTFYSNDLWSLTVSQNKLVALRDDILPPGQKLIHLDASNNSIQEFSFKHFKTTLSLSLNDNLLTVIDFGTFFSFTDRAPASVKSYIYLRRNKIQRIIPPQECRTSLQRKQTVDTEIYMKDNFIPETFSPLEIFPCANGHVKNNISGKIYLNLERNCFCRESIERVGGLEIQTYSADCKDINKCQINPTPSTTVPVAIDDNFRNHVSTPDVQSSSRFSFPKPNATTTTTKDPEADTTQSVNILGLRKSVLYAIAASGVVCVIIIVITVAVCCFKKRQKHRESAQQKGSNPATNNNRPSKDQSHSRSTPQSHVHAAPPNRYEASFFPGRNPDLPGAAPGGHLHHQGTGQQLGASTPDLDNSDAHSDYSYMYLDTDQMGHLSPNLPYNKMGHLTSHTPYDNAHKLRGQNNFHNQHMHVVQ